MGVAGAGKSMQGKILAEKLGYRWLSTGELLRGCMSGEQKEEMEKGKLLSDDELIKIMDKALLSVDQKHMVLDGFPRTLPQADWLLDKHEAGTLNIDMVILLEVPKESVLKRLLARGRRDDTEQAISQRFQEHEKMTLPIISRYKTHGIRVEEVNGEKPIEEVSQNIASLFTAK